MLRTRTTDIMFYIKREFDTLSSLHFDVSKDDLSDLQDSLKQLIEELEDEAESL